MHTNTHSLASWDQVFRPKNKGGHNVIHLKFRTMHSFWSSSTSSCTKHMCRVWCWCGTSTTIKYKRKQCMCLDPSGIAISSLWLTYIEVRIIVFTPRAGVTILLWTDGNPLANSLVHLFSYSNDEDISLAQFHSNQLSPSTLDRLKQCKSLIYSGTKKMLSH